MSFVEVVPKVFKHKFAVEIKFEITLYEQDCITLMQSDFNVECCNGEILNHPGKKGTGTGRNSKKRNISRQCNYKKEQLEKMLTESRELTMTGAAQRGRNGAQETQSGSIQTADIQQVKGGLQPDTWQLSYSTVTLSKALEYIHHFQEGRRCVKPVFVSLEENVK